MPKILVADDSITVRKVAERLLTEAGMEVALAASGEEALAWLANERPDFIISDVIMPDKSGYDVCKFVRSHAELSKTPFLLISGIVNDDVARKAESCRADGVLKKPFQGASLQDRVLELLAKKGEQGTGVSVSETSASKAPEPYSEQVSPQPADPVVPAPKVFRITEEQLRTLRESAARIQDLETTLADERMRAERLTEQLQAAQLWEQRHAELQACFTEQRQHVADLEAQAKRLADLEGRNRELEAALADLQSKLAAVNQLPESQPLESQPRSADLHALLMEQQQRLTDLANQVMKHGEAEDKIRTLEASLANERSRADEMALRCAEMERTATRASMRMEDLSRLLNQIARLASNAEENSVSAP
jgi:CheY-like chemotaxis protein